MDKNNKKKAKKIKKNGKNRWILVVLLFICVLVLIFAVIKIIDGTKKNKETSKMPASLVISEEEVLVENEQEKAEIQDDVSSGENPEETVLEPEWECYLSEDFLEEDSDWNLINTVENAEGVTDYIPVNPKFYYAAYCPAEMTITSFDSDKNEIASVTKNVSLGEYFSFTDEARYVKIGFTENNNYFVSSGINVDTKEQPNSDRAFYVISPNAPVEMSVSRAVSYLKHWGTVLILPGVYQDNICDYYKVVNLYGVDRDKCQIVSYDGDYDNPPLEISAGYVRNLSFMALGTDNAHDRKAYAVHADYDYQNSKSLTFYNCYMYSDYNSGLGMGTRSGNVTVNSCSIVGHNVENGDFFLHDTVDPAFAGECNVTIKNSSINHLVLNAMEIEGNNVYLTMKNNSINIIEGHNTVTDGSVEGFYLGLRNFTLSPDSDVQ